MDVASNWGLTVTLVKTKGMKNEDEQSSVDDVPVYNQLVEKV